MFSSLCKIAGYEDAEIGKLWQSTLQQTIEQLIDWLIKEQSLTRDQLAKLDGVFNKLMDEDESPSQPFIEIVEPILTEEQLESTTKKQAEFFVENLEQCYTEMKKRMSLSQRQVADAYMENVYGRNS